jgi:hypothetical protein
MISPLVFGTVLIFYFQFYLIGVSNLILYLFYEDYIQPEATIVAVSISYLLKFDCT